MHARLFAPLARRRFTDFRRRGDLFVGKTPRLELFERGLQLNRGVFAFCRGGVHSFKRRQLLARFGYLFHLAHKPRVNAAPLAHLLRADPARQRRGDITQPLRIRLAAHFLNGFRRDVFVRAAEPVAARLQTAHRLLQRFGKCPAYRHHFADRAHLRRQFVRCRRELRKVKTRRFHDNVIQGRLKRRRGFAVGDVVFDFVQRVADGEFRRHLRYRKTRRLGRQRRRARHARVHFYHRHFAVGGIDGKLHIRAAGVHAYLAQHRNRRIAHALVFLVGQSLRRRDGYGVAGVHAHRVYVFYGTHDDAIVRLVAHDFKFKFFPAQKRALH